MLSFVCYVIHFSKGLKTRQGNFQKARVRHVVTTLPEVTPVARYHNLYWCHRLSPPPISVFHFHHLLQTEFHHSRHSCPPFLPPSSLLFSCPSSSSSSFSSNQVCPDGSATIVFLRYSGFTFAGYFFLPLFLVGINFSACTLSPAELLKVAFKAGKFSRLLIFLGYFWRKR